MKKILIVLVLLMVSPVFAGNIDQYKDENGVLHLNISGSGKNTYQKEPEIERAQSTATSFKTPIWKDELDNICNQTKDESNNMKPEANDYVVNTLLEKAKDLHNIIKNSAVDATYKYANLRLLASCEDLLNNTLAARKQRRGYNDLVQSLKDKLK